MTTMPRITRYPDGSVVLTFPYDAELVALLKDRIPSWHRRYDPATKAWTIAAPFAGQAAQIMGAIFPDHEIAYAATGATWTPPSAPPEDAWSVLHLRPTAPPELIDAAYRCLSKLHHPDRGGDTASMQRINSAVTQIRSRS